MAKKKLKTDYYYDNFMWRFVEKIKENRDLNLDINALMILIFAESTMESCICCAPEKIPFAELDVFFTLAAKIRAIMDELNEESFMRKICTLSLNNLEPGNFNYCDKTNCKVCPIALYENLNKL